MCTNDDKQYLRGSVDNNDEIKQDGLLVIALNTTNTLDTTDN